MKAFKVIMKDFKEKYIVHLMDIPENHPIEVTAEEYYRGKCISATPVELADDDFSVSEMVDGQNYELLADSDTLYDTVIFVKQGDKIFATIRGIDFGEPGLTFYFQLGEYLNNIEFLEDLDTNNLTVRDLETIERELYEIVMLVNVPEEYKDKTGVVSTMKHYSLQEFNSDSKSNIKDYYIAGFDRSTLPDAVDSAQTYLHHEYGIDKFYKEEQVDVEYYTFMANVKGIERRFKVTLDYKEV